MKWDRIFAMIVLLYGPCCYAQTTPSIPSPKQSSLSPAFSIELAPPAEPIHFGSPIDISVTVTNISDKGMTWDVDRGKNSVYKTFVVALRKDGREVET